MCILYVYYYYYITIITIYHRCADARAAYDYNGPREELTMFTIRIYGIIYFGIILVISRRPTKLRQTEQAHKHIIYCEYYV